MNRYLVRSLVAILTFSIGVAVGAIFRTTTPTYYQPRHKRCKEFVPERKVYSYVPQGPSPSVAIDNASTDPIKLRYAQTRLNSTGSKPQIVEFSVEPTSRRQIAKYTLSYRSRWPSRNQGSGAILVTNAFTSITSGVPTFDNVAIECDADETLSVWIASVEFMDGSRWENPRHSFN
jgi:hypothetical protein